jgi:hypothetical protein
MATKPNTTPAVVGLSLKAQADVAEKTGDAFDTILAEVYSSQEGLYLLETALHGHEAKLTGGFFVIEGLRRHLAAIERVAEDSGSAARQARPRFSEEAARQLLVRRLAQELGVEIAKDELAAIASRYEAEATADPEAPSCVLFDRARRAALAEAG